MRCRGAVFELEMLIMSAHTTGVCCIHLGCVLHTEVCADVGADVCGFPCVCVCVCVCGVCVCVVCGVCVVCVVCVCVCGVCLCVWCVCVVCVLLHLGYLRPHLAMNSRRARLLSP